MPGFKFRETYVVAVTRKWAEASVDDLLYTDKVEAEGVAAYYNRTNDLKPENGASVLTLPSYISMMEIVAERDREGC